MLGTVRATLRDSIEIRLIDKCIALIGQTNAKLQIRISSSSTKQFNNNNNIPFSKRKTTHCETTMAFNTQTNIKRMNITMSTTRKGFSICILLFGYENSISINFFFFSTTFPHTCAAWPAFVFVRNGLKEILMMDQQNGAYSVHISCCRLNHCGWLFDCCLENRPDFCCLFSFLLFFFFFSTSFNLYHTRQTKENMK